MRDEVRRRVGVGLYETAQALYIYSRFKALYRLFCERFPACNISFALFKQLKPWYVRRAKQETCLCKHCENCKVHKEVMSSLVELFKDVVGPPCLDCEDDAEDAGDNDNDEDRVEAQGWRGKVELMKLLRLGGLQSKADMIKFVLCEGALEGAGKTPCIEGACSRCGFDKIWSKGLRPHVVDAYGNIRPSTPIEFQNIVSWTRASTSSRVSTEASAPKAPKYEAHSGTVTQFLDAVERDVFRKYPHHRHTVTRQKAMSAQFARNCTPGWLRCAVDFAMDGEIPPPGGRAAQSDHWSPVTYTLFVMVVSWLERESWVSRDSNLKIGDLVTVEPPEQSTVGSVDAVLGSYFAEIVKVPEALSACEAENQVYHVRRHGGLHEEVGPVERKYLRHRKTRTEAFPHVSNDKTHDSAAAQTFICKTLDHLHVEYVQTGKESFFALHLHSDNAASHFKSSQTMNFVSTLPERLQSWAERFPFSMRVFWEFGAPGHGKGVWDGIGAWMKRTVRQDIIDDRPQKPILRTVCGKILIPEHAAEHLIACFNTMDFEEKHIDSTINKVVVLYTPTEEIKRPPGHKFTPMPGMKKSFLFMAIRTGVVLQRQFSCWCMACMRASAAGEGTMDSCYKCHECEEQGLTWRETVVEREDAAGVQERR